MSLFDHHSDGLEDLKPTAALLVGGSGPRPDAAVRCPSGPTFEAGKWFTEQSPEPPLNSAFKRRRRLVLQRTPPGYHVGPDGGKSADLRVGQETEKRESQSSSSNTASLDEELATQPFIPNWEITNGTLLNTPDICREFMHRVLPPKERLFNRNRRMIDQALSERFCTYLVSLLSFTYELHRRWVSMVSFREKARRKISSLKETLSQVTATKVDLLHQIFTLEQQQSGSATKAARAEEELERVRADVARLEVEREQVVRSEQEKQDKVSKLNALVSSLQAEVLELGEAEKYARAQLSVKEGTWKIESESLEKTATLAVVRANELKTENTRLKQDQHWLISKGMSQVVNKVKASREFCYGVESICKAADRVGYQSGLEAGYHYAGTGVGIEETPNFDHDAGARVKVAIDALISTDHSLIKKISESTDLSLEELKALIGSTSC